MCRKLRDADKPGLADTQLALMANAATSSVVANPVDLTGAAGAAEYRAATDVLLADDVDAVLVVHTTLEAGGHDDVAAAVDATAKPVLASYAGAGARQTSGGWKVPAFDYPEAAVKASPTGQACLAK